MFSLFLSQCNETSFFFEARSKTACKHLWKCSVEHHTFFRYVNMKVLFIVPINENCICLYNKNSVLSTSRNLEVFVFYFFSHLILWIIIQIHRYSKPHKHIGIFFAHIIRRGQGQFFLVYVKVKLWYWWKLSVLQWTY